MAKKVGERRVEAELWVGERNNRRRYTPVFKFRQRMKPVDIANELSAFLNQASKKKTISFNGWFKISGFDKEEGMAIADFLSIGLALEESNCKFYEITKTIVVKHSPDW